MKFNLDEKHESIAKAIVDSAYTVHRRLGPGLLESVYEACFCYELTKRGLTFKRQLAVPLTYDDLRFQCALRLDVIVENLAICELKAVDVLPPISHAQLLTYLKLTMTRLGFLINFNVPLIKDGIRRIIC